jgi:AcrR family transcriptional regulator
LTGVSTPRPTASAPDRTTGRVRNRRGEGGKLRLQILAAAGELLDEAGGAEAVTLRAVARRAGIAAPSIYAHFADPQSILLALVQDAFTELSERLSASTDPDPVGRLRAICAAYLDFAQTRPQRYRVMFGGVWNVAQALEQATISESDAAVLGQDALGVIVDGLQACADAGRSTSSDPRADGIALWLGLHGLAHQRVAAAAFAWPDDIAVRIIDPLAHLTQSNPSGS